MKIDLRPFKCKTWNGEDLKGYFHISYKLDGVMTIVKDGIATSRANKPLYNLPELEDGVYEVYLNNFDATISAVHTRIEGAMIDGKHIFKVYPVVDDRIRIYLMKKNPDKAYIENLLGYARNQGFEGLIVRNLKTEDIFKVKPNETHDVLVTGFIPGKGRNKGRIGALTTDMGNVSSGLTDKLREDFSIIGLTIEVECMELTKDGKFRHPRFIRIRNDK